MNLLIFVSTFPDELSCKDNLKNIEINKGLFAPNVVAGLSIGKKIKKAMNVKPQSRVSLEKSGILK